MSADNWTVCYHCRVERDKEIAAVTESMGARLSTAYGRETASEYEDLRRTLQHELDELTGVKLDPTWSETYEIYGAQDGIITVCYGGSCTVCGHRTNFTYDHPIDKETE